MSSAGDVSVVSALPQGYAEDLAAVAPPSLAQTSSVTIEQWQASCAHGDCSSQVVFACFRASASTWSPEVDDLVQDKLTEVASQTANRARGEGALHVTGRRQQEGVSERRLEGDGLAAKTLVGFTASPSTVHACFALSLGPRGKAVPAPESVDHARISGALVAPPATSAGLGAVIAMIHHPGQAVGAFAALVCALGLVAIALRRKPRRPPRRPRYSGS